MPQHAGLHHIALLHRGDLVAPRARKLEGDASDALDFVGVVHLGIDRALLAVAQVGDGLRLTEVHAAGELAQDHDVEPVHDLALEARGIGQRRIAERRADVGEQAEVFAQPQQARFGAHVVRHAVPFRSADRAEQHGIGGFGLRHRLVGHGDLVGVVGRAADQRFLGLEPGDPALVHPGDHALDLAHDLGADAIAGEEQKIDRGHEQAFVGLRICPNCYRRAAAVWQGSTRVRQPRSLTAPNTDCARGPASRSCAHGTAALSGTRGLARRRHRVCSGTGPGHRRRNRAFRLFVAAA